MIDITAFQYIVRLREENPELKRFLKFNNISRAREFVDIRIHIPFKHYPALILFFELALILATVKRKPLNIIIDTLFKLAIEVILKSVIPLLKQKGATIKLNSDIMLDEIQKKEFSKFEKAVKNRALKNFFSSIDTDEDDL